MPVVGGRYIKKAKGESLESVRSKYAHQCTKALTKEAKLVKGFVQQKLVRRLAELKKEGSKEGTEGSADFVKCLRDLEAIKALPHVKVGEAGSRRVLATSPDADAGANAGAGAGAGADADGQADEAALIKQLLQHKRLVEAVAQWMTGLQDTLSTKKVKAGERVGHVRPSQEEQQASKRPRRVAAVTHKGDSGNNLFVGSLRDDGDANEAALARRDKKRQVTERRREKDRGDTRGMSNFAMDRNIYGPGDGTDVAAGRRRGRPPTEGYVRDDQGSSSGTTGNGGGIEVVGGGVTASSSSSSSSFSTAAAARPASAPASASASVFARAPAVTPAPEPAPTPAPAATAATTRAVKPKAAVSATGQLGDHHPSWLAKQKAKEQSKNALTAAAGVRVTFDDSDSDSD